MRPLELGLRNFRSFFTPKGNEVSFDFRERRLIGIVGPIGSGKSTLLDAIAFALYGRTPRIARSTKSLVHQRAENAHVRLRFEVDGEIWEAVRMIRASKGASQHALYRYEADTPHAEPVEKIVQESDVNARITELLGFEFEAFGRSVLLAQGQFAEFLTARPAERDKVLKGVFGHERIDAMRELAKDRVRQGEYEIDKLQLRLEAAEQAIARLARRRIEYSEAEDRAALLDKHADRVADLNERQLAASRAAVAAGDRQKELERHAGRMPDPDKTEELLAIATTARAERSRLAAELEKAHAAVTSAEAGLKSEVREQAKSRLARAEAAMTERRLRVKDLELADQQHAAAASRHATAAAGAAHAAEHIAAAELAVATVQDTAELARAAALAADTALHSATHADMAATLRADLRVGAACPVCEQAVAAIPGVSPSPEVAAARVAAEGSVAELRRAEQDLADSSARLASARTSADDAAKRVDEIAEELAQLGVAREAAVAALAALDADLAAALGDGDPTAEIERLSGELAAAETQLDAARRVLEDVRRTHDAAIAREQDTDRALGDLRTQLSALAALLHADADVPEDDPAALRAALHDLRATWTDAAAALRAEMETATDEAGGIASQLDELFTDLAIETSFEAAKAEAEAAVGILGRAIEEDEQVIAKAEDLISARRAEVDRVDRFRRISGDLTDAKFIRYLLDEERASLAELGSDHFQRLSSGRYRFTDDGTFEVVDLTAADAVRKADSLSGGETFLASLALALGLAEMVSRTGGRLDAFFLDEGFGSLDQEHLDLAMDGIEQLVADGSNRLVVIVSHVPEMRQRMEDLIVLDRDATTGDSIVVAGATA
ncbi:MAG: SMC family ATPase [Acidimicrobiia bacterium]|nr:SMC family ATPase [Acidimicrobiia bacterium]